MATELQNGLDPQPDNDLLVYETKVDTDSGAHGNEIDWEEHDDVGGIDTVAPTKENEKDTVATSVDAEITYEETYDETDLYSKPDGESMGADELTYEDDEIGIGAPSAEVASLDAQGEAIVGLEADDGDEITYDEMDGYGDAALQTQDEALIDYATFPTEDLPEDPGEDDDPVPNEGEGEDYDEGDQERPIDGWAQGDLEANQGAVTNALHVGDILQKDKTDDLAVDHDDSDKSADQEDSPFSDADGYPDISVSYRNEEFPLFHGQNNIDTQMGFFDDIGILDQTMDQLLASFREEISDDLGIQDEIVLQVDELGLEYAESTQRDHLSGVTLRQLHEIFDQLAKNQDPDASRTLYTYLSIRPGPSKRLEILIEEAFNGKGLDEITFCFHPATSHKDARQGGAETADENGGGGGDDVEDVPDRAYDSDNASGSRDVEGEFENSPQYAQGGYPSVDDAESLEDGGAALYDEDEPQPEGERVSEADASSHGDYQDDDLIEDDALDDIENQAPLASIAPATYEEDNDNDFETFQVVGSEVEVGQLTEQNAYDADFQTHDLTGDAEQTAGDDPGFDYIDLIDDDAGEEDGIENTKAKVTSNNTSATATLNGDNEITYDEGDLGLDTSGDATTQDSALLLDDAADEIDWRDPPGQGDDDTKPATAGAGKRPREEEDDVVGWEEEKDVKRRRS